MAMSELWIHPSVILLAGALLVPFVRGKARSALLLLVPLLAFARIASLAHGTFGTVQFLDWTLTFGRVDKLSQVFGYIMGLMCVLGSLYGIHVKRAADHSAAWCYVAGSLGVIYAGDYLVLFLFWELMAFSSVFLIWLQGSKTSQGTGYRYLLPFGRHHSPVSGNGRRLFVRIG